MQLPWRPLLASCFTEEQLSGVGISISLTRLVPRLIEAGILKVGPATTAPVWVTALEENRTREYLRIGTMLREAGVPTEVYFEKARLGEQLRYAHTGLDHGIGHLRPLSITWQHHLLAYHDIAMSHAGLGQVF